MNKPPPQQVPSRKKIRIRIVLVGIVFLLAFGLISARAFELHLTDNVKLNRLAKNQYKRKVIVAPKRGNILDTNGETLAIDIKVDSVYATPNTITDPQKLAKTLSKLLSKPEKKILDRLNNNKKKFVWIRRRISEEESKKLKKLNLKGVGTLPEYKRFYPNGNLAANLIGAVGFDAKALSGLELEFDKTLKSDDPPLLVETDAKGRTYAPYALVGLENPNQIVLTIDKTIQYIAERELHGAVEKAKAKGGVAIVVKVDTGEILALAVSPTFDPNEYFKYEFSSWRNRAITDIFEPGSIFKAITAATALETNVIDLDKKIHCQNGAMKVGSHVIHDHHGYGLLKLKEIIKYSSNICSYKLAHKIGKKRFYEFIRKFGFGSKTGIEIPGELIGLVTPEKRVTPIQLGTIGFGQGISTTPLQIAMAYATIANGGFLMKPFLVKQLLDSKGNVLKSYGPKIIRRVLEEKTAQKTTELLETVVEKGGTGTQAHLKNYRVAGKTGTAQKVIEGQKGYAKNKYIASFIGFAPSRDPSLVVLVSIDEPQGAYYGGMVSGPVFKKIMGQSLAFFQVPPSESAPEKQEKRVAKKPKKGNFVKKTGEAKQKKSQENVQAEQRIAKLVKKNNNLEDSSKISPEATPVPNLKGLSVREAMRKAQANNFKLRIEGSGICHEQNPPPGDRIETGTAIVVECSPPI